MNIQGLLGGIGQALSNPKFRLLWWTNTVNSTGRWQYKFAVSWYTWETTKSPALLGIVAFADTVPLVFMTVIAMTVINTNGTVSANATMPNKAGDLVVSHVYQLTANLYCQRPVLLTVFVHQSRRNFGLDRACPIPPRRP